MLRMISHRLLLPMTITAMLVAFGERVGSVAKAASGSESNQTKVAAVLPSNAPHAGSEADKRSEERVTASALQARQDELTKKAAELDERSELIAAAEQKLQKKLDQLQKLQATLEDASRARDARLAANWSGLVKTYEAMKPDDAAGIFNVLDSDVLLEVLDRMDARKEASILAAMVPERARQATQMLAHKRTRDGGAVASLSGG